MSLFKCKMCGGDLEINNSETVATCEYCGTQQTLPKLEDNRRANLYDRANHLRRNNEYDKAMGIYEQILNEDNTDAEAYWSIVLCRYGIEYVEDSSSHKRIPTINRAQFTSIFDDNNYKSALRYADGYQRSIYEGEAREINEIQKIFYPFPKRKSLLMFLFAIRKATIPVVVLLIAFWQMICITSLPKKGLKSFLLVSLWKINLA